MKKVILYFPDSVNMQAFIILEKVAGTAVDEAKALLETTLNEQQLNIACMKYGAILKADENQQSFVNG
ncbi:MAG: hypothetical protein ACM3VS_13170 [Candidatus Dadabacteria bacterium]